MLLSRFSEENVEGLTANAFSMSSVTDPYQPIERKLKLTRSLLEELAKPHKPHLVAQTRSPDVVHDAAVYRKIVDRGGRVQINMTVTTDDEEVRRTFEPQCPANFRRLESNQDNGTGRAADMHYDDAAALVRRYPKFCEFPY